MQRAKTKNVDKIIEASIELFKEKGYQNVSVNEICQRSNLSRSSFYAVFPSKLDTIIYVLNSVKSDLSQNATGLLLAEENDFERMMAISNRYMELALEYGPELLQSLFALEMTEDLDVFSGVHGADDWFINLTRNGQKAGIIRNHTPAEVLVPIAVDMQLQVVYSWAKQKGRFPLLERSRQCAEATLDVVESSRRFPSDG